MTTHSGFTILEYPPRKMAAANSAKTREGQSSRADNPACTGVGANLPGGQYDSIPYEASRREGDSVPPTFRVGLVDTP